MWTSLLCLSSLVVYIDTQTAEQLAAVDAKVAAVQQEILEAIDECRKTVNPSASNMLKMEWSPGAAQTAESYAKQCQFKHSNKIQRTIPGFTCGEILYTGSDFVSWTKAIKSSCNEQKDFEYGKGKTSPQAITEDVTQLVRYDAFLVGCSAAYCATGEYRWFFVCHQCPYFSGNIAPAVQPYDAGTPCDDCPNNCNDGLCSNSCEYTNDISNCRALKERCDDVEIQAVCKRTCLCPNV